MTIHCLRRFVPFNGKLVVYAKFQRIYAFFVFWHLNISQQKMQKIEEQHILHILHNIVTDLSNALRGFKKEEKQTT